MLVVGNPFISYFETEAEYDNDIIMLKSDNRSTLDFISPSSNREFESWEKYKVAFGTWMSRLIKDETIFKD